MEITQYLSIASEKATESILSLATKIGLSATPRWAGLITLFLALLILYIAVKISQPLIKIILIILGILIIVGLLIPW